MPGRLGVNDNSLRMAYHGARHWTPKAHYRMRLSPKLPLPGDLSLDDPILLVDEDGVNLDSSANYAISAKNS